MHQRFTFLLLLLSTLVLSTQAQPNVFPATGNVGIGTGSPQQKLHVESAGNIAMFVSTSPLGGSSGSGMIGYTQHLPTASGQRLGFFLLGSRGGGNNYYHGVGMAGYAQGAWSATSWPAYLTFETTPSGSNTRVERLRIAADGNVGIGTASPAFPLDVQNNFVFGRFKSSGGFAGIIIDKSAAAQNGYIIHRTAGSERWVEGTVGNDNFAIRNWSAGVNSLSIDYSNHNVSIGGGNLIFNNGTQSVQFANPGTTSNPMINMFASGTSNNDRMAIGHSPAFPTWGLRYSDNVDRFDFVAGGDPKVSINLTTGRMGIGTTTPSYPLSVNGTIQAKELRIETGWADYVFEKGYKLMPLSEVEKYIAQYKHLPGITPAKEIQEKGLAVGDMQTKMMEKIEELTLYVIELQKRIQQLENNQHHRN
jgi:hypothetical protein